MLFQRNLIQQVVSAVGNRNIVKRKEQDMDVKEYNEIIEWANEKGGLEFKAFMEIVYKAYVNGTILNFEDESQSFSGQVKRIFCFYNPRFPDFDLGIKIGDSVFKSIKNITMEDFKILSDTEYVLLSNGVLQIKINL